MDSEIQPQTFYLENKAVLRNPALPIVIYKKFMERETALKSRIFEQTFIAHGWRGTWRNGIFDYHHFHSNAHEVLGIARGSVKVQLGGEYGEMLELEAGDVVILPAGTGHKKLSGSDNLAVVGAYPAGQEEYDICREASKAAAKRITSVPLPALAPLYGENGPLMEIWPASAAPASEKISQKR